MAIIYQILNIITGKFYIGSSINHIQRWVGHRTSLKHNKHYNPYLQKAWNKYGESAFEFCILHECETENLAKIEHAMLNMYVGTEWCYNIQRNAYAPGRDRVWTAEERKRLSDQRKNMPLSIIHTPESCKKISDSKKGKPRTEETKNKLRNSMKLSDCKKFKFSIIQKTEMIRMFETNKYSKKELAKLFNCSESHFGRIVRHITRSERK